MARGEGEFILMLGAGNALGAIQGGVYEALAEAGRLPTRFAGVSICSTRRSARRQPRSTR